MRQRALVDRSGLGWLTVCFALAVRAVGAAEQQLPLEITGGHEIGRNDFGRPVVLIAAALNVKPDEFRKAFSGVTPAKGGPPSGDEARRNKTALMRVLAPLGVTNERLDEVSNYYRYQPQRGELWKTSAAKGHAVVENGKVKQIVITAAGSGYSVPPRVTIKGLDSVKLKATLHFEQQLVKNGSLASVEVVEPEPAR